MTQAESSTFATTIRSQVTCHSGQSGLHALANAHDAFAARLAVADAAEHTLDVQYYIWKKDMTGMVLLEWLFRAADRGVHVRLLLDDLGTMPSDKAILSIDSHPNIEVRMFNPVAWRSLRVLGIAADFARVNRRMHNKSFIADGQIAIVGGRNIGNEYYGANTVSNFADLDVAVIGPVVSEASKAFELYWNHSASVPITKLSRHRAMPEEYETQRKTLVANYSTAAKSEYAERLRNSEFARQLHNHAVPFLWGNAEIVLDHPDKVLTASSLTDTHLAPKLRELVDRAQQELYLVSPYFVPGSQGVELLTEVRRRGVRVVVVTNSLAATDGVPVHSGYQRYRKALLEAGVELYELKPTVTSGGRIGGVFGSRGSGGSSGSSLHAKTFTFDRRIGFVGSYNLDPRSSRLNTEMGVVFDCPELAAQVPETLDRDLPDIAYRVGLENNRLFWTTRNAGQEERYTTEPVASRWKRAASLVLSWLPIEELL